MKNIHVIATEKPSRLVIDTIGNKLSIQGILHNKTVNVLPQNIYITNDEEIKIGDWYLNGVIPTNERINKSRGTNVASFYKSNDVKKIILTTDQDLIKDGVQAIDDEFLNWFVGNPSCEEVKVIDFHTYFTQDVGNKGFYKIIIPKEEPIHLLSCCKSLEECHCGKYPKQATLEEATEIYVNKYYSEEGYKRDIEESIKFGAKWQESQMYGEEEVGELVYNIIGEYGKHYGIMIDGSKLNELFKQFKK